MQQVQFTVKITKGGGTFRLTIPKQIIERNRWKTGDKLTVTVLMRRDSSIGSDAVELPGIVTPRGTAVEK